MSEETTTTSESTEASETTTEATVIDQTTGEETITTYVNGKYESVSALEDGYNELQKSYSQKLGGFDGAPEAYEYAEGVESTPRIEALEKWGKDNQLSNDGINSLIAMDAEATKATSDAWIAEQKDILGKDADTRLTNVADWAKAQVGEDYMTAFNGMITSAKGVEMMEMFMKNSQGVAPTVQKSTPQAASKEQLHEMRYAIDKNSGERRMSIDPAYRAKVEAMEAELHG